jgi:hypothetical protein
MTNHHLQEPGGSDDGAVRTLSNLPLIITAMIGAQVVLGLAAAGAVYADVVSTQPEPQTVLLGALALLGVGELIGFQVLRLTWINNQKQAWSERSPDEDPVPHLAQPFIALTINRAAMAEGWGIFGIGIFLVTGNLLGLAAAVISLVLLLPLLAVDDRFRQYVLTITGRSR